MNYTQWMSKSHPLHISTYMKVSHKMKTVKGKQQSKKQGMINNE
jgi:hypothetical protein